MLCNTEKVDLLLHALLLEGSFTITTYRLTILGDLQSGYWGICTLKTYKILIYNQT
jgi:hypothetical protein